MGWVSYSKVIGFPGFSEFLFGQGFSGQEWFQWIRDYLFIVNALTNARNGWIGFESGSRLFKIAIFEHPRPRNEPHKTVLRIPGTQDDGKSSRNRFLWLFKPKTGTKRSKNPKIPRKSKNPENPITLL